LRQAASGHGVPQPAPVAGEGTLADDVLTAVGKQNLILPGGTAKMGHFEYDVDLNAELKTVQEFNDLPIKTVGGGRRLSPRCRNGKRWLCAADKRGSSKWQSRRAADVLKAGDASTIDVVKGIRELLAAALTGLMILLFLGSWRSTLIIAISIPLSILT
jgi:multidrug efflux pump subunit AcrB